MKLAIVSHDAGGAEILSSYVSQYDLHPSFVLDGPARAIFTRKLGLLKVLHLEDAIKKCDLVLCGSSWQSDLEWRAIDLARKLEKRVVVFLDHWVNYRERFIRDGVEHLPDEIWVGDAIAERLATAGFSSLPVRMIENPYLLEIQRELELSRTVRTCDANNLSVLYVAEPISEHGRLQFSDERHWGYVEEEALRYFLVNVGALGNCVSRIRIRPHPSESQDKYSWALREFNLPIVQGGSRTLVEEIADSDVIVGCESMALVVGLLAGKRVVSCIPPGGKPCSLPHREIVLLETLIKANPTVLKEARKDYDSKK